MSFTPQEIAAKFIEYIESIGEIDNLPEILEEIEAQSSTQKVIVESANSLTSEIQKTISEILEIKLGHKPQIEFTINPELIGGIRVRIDDDLFDFSIQSQVESLFRNSN